MDCQLTFEQYWQSGVKFLVKGNHSKRIETIQKGLNPGPPDPEFKVLTILSDTPPKWKRMHRNQTKKQSDGLAVLVLKTKSKW